MGKRRGEMSLRRVFGTRIQKRRQERTQERSDLSRGGEMILTKSALVVVGSIRFRFPVKNKE